MRLLLLIAASTITLVLQRAPAAADVIFDFYETGIVSCGNGYGDCSLPPQPFVLMSITLSRPTEVGSAYWSGSPTQLPVVTDPGLVFQLSTGERIAGPGFDYNPTCLTGPGDCFVDD